MSTQLNKKQKMIELKDQFVHQCAKIETTISTLNGLLHSQQKLAKLMIIGFPCHTKQLTNLSEKNLNMQLSLLTYQITMQEQCNKQDYGLVGKVKNNNILKPPPVYQTENQKRSSASSSTDTVETTDSSNSIRGPPNAILTYNINKIIG